MNSEFDTDSTNSETDETDSEFTGSSDSETDSEFTESSDSYAESTDSDSSNEKPVTAKRKGRAMYVYNVYGKYRIWEWIWNWNDTYNK